MVLPPGSSPTLTVHEGGTSSWRRSKRSPWSAALHWLDEASPTASLIDLAPADGIADWLLAKCLARVPDPALRTPALKAFGMDRAIAALRLCPVQEDSRGRLFQIGPRDAPSVFVLVNDHVVDSNGFALAHWISVPPHVATAHEAVAWTFGMTERTFYPARET